MMKFCLILTIFAIMDSKEVNCESGISTLSIDSPKSLTLFDFTKLPDLEGWSEVSDTVRTVGKSKASFVLQKTREFQRGVFFSMLNPQPNGACFAGYVKQTHLDLSDYNGIELWLRGQGQNYGYKVTMRHKGLNRDPNPTYEHFFQVPKNDFGSVRLEFLNFEPYYQGSKLNISEVGALDKSNITSIGIQTYGGVYLPVKQSGTSSLEIDWIKAVV